MINKFTRKISGKEAVRAGKGFYLFILNEDTNDIIKIIKSLEDSGILIDVVTEKVKHLLALLAASLVQPIISSVVKDISG